MDAPSKPAVEDPIRLSDGTEIKANAQVDQDDQQVVVERPRGSLPSIILATIASLAVCYVARDVIVPCVFALMLALLLRPLLRHMKRWHLPNGASALILVGLVVIVFVIALVSLAGQVQTSIANASETIRKVREMIPTRDGPLGDLKEASDAVKEMTADESNPSPPVQVNSTPDQDWAYAALGVSGHFFGASLVVFVLAYFLLALSDQLLKQLVEAMPTFCEKRNVVELVQNVEVGMSRYLATITVINIGLGLVTGVAMWLLDLPNPVLWGVMATTLNYVPHVGAFVSMVVLFLVGSLAHGSLWYGLAAGGTFALITTIESYFVTPLMLSHRLELSPLAVILSILFFGWLWGVGGGLLAAPLLAVIKIICDQFQSLHAVSALLAGGGKRHESADSGAADANSLRQQAA